MLETIGLKILQMVLVNIIYPLLKDLAIDLGERMAEWFAEEKAVKQIKADIKKIKETKDPKEQKNAFKDFVKNNRKRRAA